MLFSPTRRCLPLLLLGLFVLAGCASAPTIPGCPKVGFVKDLDRVTVFRPGGGEDLTEVLFDARLAELVSICDPSKEGMAVQTVFKVVASRGPADTERVADIEYFVAIVDRAGNITAKEVFGTRIPFADNRRRVGVREEVEPTIPNPRAGTFDDFKVLIGLQLSEKQLGYNRRTRR